MSDTAHRLQPIVFGEYSPSPPLLCLDGAIASIDDLAGRASLLVFYGNCHVPETAQALDTVIRLAPQFQAQVRMICVTPTPQDHLLAARLPERCAIWCDQRARAHKAFGLSLRETPETLWFRPMAFVLDAQLRVRGSWLLSEIEIALAKTAELLRETSPSQPPVQLVPEVFSEDFRARLRRNAAERISVLPSGLAGAFIDDSGLREELTTTLRHRLLPSLARAFGIEPAFLQRRLALRLTPASSLILPMVRDGDERRMSHRLLSVIMPLDAGEDGVLVHFPEYGGRAFPVRPGEALVHSSRLLRTLAPANGIEALVFMPVLHGHASEALADGPEEPVNSPIAPSELYSLAS